MKKGKIILITVLISSFLVSCDMVKQEDIVINVEEFKKGRYEVETNTYYFYTDSMYHVGDTLKVGKKTN